MGAFDRPSAYLISKEVQPHELHEAGSALFDRQRVPDARGWSEGQIGG
jgi:hypothetical protein